MSIKQEDIANIYCDKNWGPCSTHICALIRGAVLLPLPLLLLLFQFLDALLQDVRPEVALKVWQLLGTGQPVFCCLLENVLKGWRGRNKVMLLMRFQRVTQSMQENYFKDSPGDGNRKKPHETTRVPTRTACKWTHLLKESGTTRHRAWELGLNRLTL